MFPRELPKTRHNTRVLSEMREMADAYLESAPECLPYSLFILFQTTGERNEYEEKYFDHRRRLNSLFFTYLDTKDEKYYLSLMDALFAVLDEYSWAVPAHIKESNVPDTVGRIDLFSAETAYALAEIDSILGDELPAMIRERIRFETDRRILTPFFSGNQNYPKNNWSAVQSAGVIATLVRLFPERLDEALPRLLPIIQQFLDSYNDDGCCMEGSLYWIYGFGFFTYGAELLREGTKGKINLFDNPKVERMAHFFENITFRDGYVVPFADSALQCKMRIGLACFLHHEFGVDYPDSNLIFAVRDDTRFRFADILHDLYWSEDFDTAGKVRLGEFFYEDSEWYIYRTEGLSFCAKGGHNKEPHNHNDIGNFVLFDGEKTVLGDLGWEEYVRNYFGPRRYLDFILTPSTGHSVPIIDGKTQTTVDKKAEIIEAKDGVFALDIGSAYGVEHFLRTMKMEGNTFTVTDECDLPFSERIVTGYEPKVDGDTVLIDTLRLTTSTPCDIEVTANPYRPRRIICGEHLKEVETAYFITLTPKAPTASLTLTFTKLA